MRMSYASRNRCQSIGDGLDLSGGEGRELPHAPGIRVDPRLDRGRGGASHTARCKGPVAHAAVVVVGDVDDAVFCVLGTLLPQPVNRIDRLTAAKTAIVNICFFIVVLLLVMYLCLSAQVLR